MVKWLQSFRTDTLSQKNQALPVVRSSSEVAPAPTFLRHEGPLPNASLIYGMAASGLFVVAIYFLFTRAWFTGCLLLLPASCFLGFALYFLKAR